MASKELTNWIIELLQLEQEDLEQAAAKFERDRKIVSELYAGKHERAGEVDMTIAKVYLLLERFDDATKLLDESCAGGRQRSTPPKAVYFQTFRNALGESVDNEDFFDVAQRLAEFVQENPMTKALADEFRFAVTLRRQGPAFQKGLKEIESWLNDHKEAKYKSQATELIINACLACSKQEDLNGAERFALQLKDTDPTSLPRLRDQLRSDPSYAPFLHSAGFKKLVATPDHPILAQAYEKATNDPFQTYQLLEKNKSSIPDQLDTLAVQLYCISIICSDLEEHGDDNMDDYGGGKIPEKKFKEIKKDLAKNLKAAIKETSTPKPPFWSFKNINSLEDL